MPRILTLRCISSGVLLLPCAVTVLWLCWGEGRAARREHVRQSMELDVEVVARIGFTSQEQPTSVPTRGEVTQVSESFDTRARLQQVRVGQFCHKHGYPVNYSLLMGTRESAYQLRRHLMFSESKRLIFCFVPKTGSTNLKRLMLYTSGHLPLHTLSWPWVENRIYLEPALQSASLLNSSLTDRQRRNLLLNYFKFTVVRHPLERLVSAFRDKLESPLDFAMRDYFPQSCKMDILKQFRPAALKRWRVLQGYHNISVSFQEFVRYVLEKEFHHDLNEHFRPATDICHPCAMGYNFYLKFSTLSADVKAIVERFGLNPDYYRDESLHSPGTETRQVMAQYYSLLPVWEQHRLVSGLWEELDFYYHLFPAERDSHLKILSLSQTSYTPGMQSYSVSMHTS